MKHYLCIILMCLFIIPQAYSTEIPLNDFVKHGDYLNMDLSPDGKHIAARIRVEGRVVVVFLDTENLKLVGGVKPRANDEIHSVRWISNERVVYQFKEKLANFDQAVATGELFATNIDGSRREILYGFRAGEKQTGTRMQKRERTLASPEVISTLVEQEKYILIAEYPWTLDKNVYRNNREQETIITMLNVFSGKKRKIEVIPYPGATPYATETGEVRYIRWIDNQGYTQSAYRKSNDDEWTEIDALNNVYLAPIGISNDGSKVFFTGNVGEKRLATVYVLDLQTGKYNQVFTDMNADIESLMFDPATQMPVVGISAPNKPTYHYADLESQTVKLHKELTASFPGSTLRIESESLAANLMLLHVSSDVNPGEYYLFNTEKLSAQFLWANRSWLDPRDLAPTKAISYETNDGFTIHGYLTLPKDASENKKAPMVVLVHGGPHGIRDSWEFDSEVQLLANRGYAVLRVNFRGSGGYGQRFMRAGYREWGGKMIQDIIDGTRYSIANFPVDENSICSYGASYGGYAALMLTIRAPELYRCTIGYVGIYDMDLMYSDSDVSEHLRYGKAYLRRAIGTDPQVLAEFSPINHVANIKADVMLIHGEKDSRVSVKNAEAMVEAFAKVGKDVPYLNFDKSGHGVYDEAGRLQLYTALLAFLDKNLK
ncbi:alpha/beta fold hydrolase [Glaciecola sp. 2405UD65-10]|uniref:alpha/beta hydrolase family protein n=1 Tax=Glaciecola sp. 2405UD65-10 TaxID=3397244 RepID=UPI003B5927BB